MATPLSRAWAVWVALLAMAAPHQVAQATGAGDLLQRPAVPSARAVTSMMTAVARAGDSLVAVGERGLVLVSKDGGRQWVQAKVPVSVLLTGVRFATPLRGWAVGHSGVVLRTDDGGMTWALQLEGVRAAEIMRAAAEKAEGDAAQIQRVRADADRLVREGADKPFLDLDVESDSVLTVIGAFGLMLRSEDGGVSWQSWGERVPNAAGSHLYGMRRKGDTLVIAGEQGAVFRSADHGHSFSAKATPSKISNFGLVVVSERHWIVYGLRGKAFVTEDGGDNWQSAGGIEESASLTAGLRREDGAIVLASQAGSLFVSTDGGHQFKKLPAPNPIPIIAIAEVADGGLVVAGIGGMSRIASSSSKDKQ